MIPSGAVLAHYALAAAKRLYGIPDFRFYAVADGMKRLLRGSTRPFAGRREPLLQEMQLSLFRTLKIGETPPRQ